MRLIAVFALGVYLPGVLVAQVVPRQSPRLELESELQDPSGLAVGVIGSFVLAGEEAFENVGPGFGGGMFVGSGFGPVKELRLGGSLASSADDLSDGRMRLVSIYLESYFGIEVVGATLRAGPRAAWARETRSSYIAGHLSGFGAGAAASISVPLNTRLWIEAGAGATMYSFGAADYEGLFDPDRHSYGLVYTISGGLKWQVR